MTASNYDACEAFVLASEGGYTNDPNDPGGPTNWGITIYDARLYWKKNATANDVKIMPKSVAQQIYRAKYWNALNCDALPMGLDYTVFDYGVNSGVVRAGKVLRQRVLGPTIDWHVTSDVISGLVKCNILKLVSDINNERLAFLQGLRSWQHFGRGWGARVARVRAESLRMAAPPLAMAFTSDAAVMGKAYEETDDAPLEFAGVA